MVKLAVQLFSVKNELKEDYLGTLRKVSQMGYEGVEFPVGLLESVKAEDLKRLIIEEKLEVAGAVFKLNELEEKFDSIVNYYKKVGMDTILYHGITKVLPGEEVRNIGKRLNTAGAYFASVGIKLLYHIHGREFEVYDGKTGMEILMEEFEPENVNLETDVYWVEWAGVNAVDFMKKYGDRTPYIHFKDMKDRVSKADIEVGDGIIDMKGIAEIGKEKDARWYIVEQEAFDIPPMKSIEVSLRNLKKIREEIYKQQ